MAAGGAAGVLRQRLSGQWQFSAGTGPGGAALRLEKPGTPRYTHRLPPASLFRQALLSLLLKSFLNRFSTGAGEGGARQALLSLLLKSLLPLLKY